MKQTTNDFKEEILSLREKGLSFEKISYWLAENKKFEVTPNAIRLLVVKQKRIEAMNK